ncbi:peptide-methionine (S)-S-oxide reductase MsrA [Propionibacteriaceae bacterium G1746]|uniref:peptide-methionine (S)-S-oxide reductase MsrA n=1 Tax=Aestuariimicrobium sp. G57 TaxID=3418485 RepID=UPI003C24BC44
MWRTLTTRTTMVSPDEALPGRDHPALAMPFFHRVLGHRLDHEFPGSEKAYFAMGCFWGAERIFWQLDGVLVTSVGYMGGYTENPTYEEVCSARTGHAETVEVVFDPARLGYAELLRAFFENHDPTQGPRQGNDIGTQYRSAIFTTTPEQQAAAQQFISAVQPRFTEKGFGVITTEVEPAGAYYLAEDYHQQYLDENPGGYCNHGPNGVSCQVGVVDLG